MAERAWRGTSGPERRDDVSRLLCANLEMRETCIPDLQQATDNNACCGQGRERQKDDALMTPSSKLAAKNHLTQAISGLLFSRTEAGHLEGSEGHFVPPAANPMLTGEGSRAGASCSQKRYKR